MSESVTLPALGESVTEGTVTRWLKQVGDRVEIDEPLLEVSTDKVDTEIPSPVAGVIEQILVAEDETVEVGSALVVIGDGSARTANDGETPARSGQEQQSQEQTQQQPEQQTEQQAEQQPQEHPMPTQGSLQTAEVPAAGVPQSAPIEDAQDTASAAPAAAAETPGQRAGEAGAGTVAAAEAEDAKTTSEAPVGPPSEPQATEPQSTGAATDAPGPVAVPDRPGPQVRDLSYAGYLTPIVRKLAHERGIDVATLTGTGVGGRIRKQDVLDAAERLRASTDEAASSRAQAATPAPSASAPSPLRGTTVPMSRLRRVVAERAVVSMQTTAQLTTVIEVDVTGIARLRERTKVDFLEKTGTKLSFLPFFTLAAAEALKSYPIINARVDGDSIVYPDHENVAIAVDTERGLLTPVVRDAGESSIAELATEIADLAARTRDNRLKPDELSGCTFTVTNTGSRGALFDTPLVFLPQVAILGTGVVVKKPVVLSHDGVDAIAVRSTVYLALSYDHRIVDGADAARFLAAVKSRLEAADFDAVLGI